MRRLRLMALMVVAGAITVLAAQQPADRSWTPGVQKAPDDSPILSPEDEMKQFYLPPGFHAELVAAEPLIQDPIAIDWDADGRMWVVEYPEYVPDLQAPEPNLDPIGRIVVLEDTDNDGKMDKRTVFADGLVQARAVKALDHGILVLEPPNVWLMHDTNGDLKVDTKELVGTDYGRREGGVEGNANSFEWGLDNYLHSAGSSVTYSLRLKDGVFDRRPTLSRGEWGVGQDDFGRMFRNDSESTLQVDLVPTPYYARNPGDAPNARQRRGADERHQQHQRGLAGPAESRHQSLVSVRRYATVQRHARAGDGRVHARRSFAAIDCRPSCTAMCSSPSRPAISSGASCSKTTVRRCGPGTRTTRRSSSASTDERFRPVFISNAPDGTLMVVDFYRGVIQDRASTTLYLQDYIQKRKLDAPTGVGRGRVYRIVHESVQRDTTRPQLSRATPAQLVEALSHPNGWWRDTAQRLLVERSGVKAVPRAQGACNRHRAASHARESALGRSTASTTSTSLTVTKALTDPSRDVRTSAVRLAERWLGEADSPVQAAVLKLIDDPDWQVREQVAASLGALATGQKETAIASLLQKHADDPVAMDAALSGARGSEPAILEKLLQRMRRRRPRTKRRS